MKLFFLMPRNVVRDRISIIVKNKENYYFFFFLVIIYFFSISPNFIQSLVGGGILEQSFYIDIPIRKRNME